MDKNNFFPKSKSQKKSLLKKMADKNPGIVTSLKNVYGGWVNEAWPESTWAEITPPPPGG